MIRVRTASAANASAEPPSPRAGAFKVLAAGYIDPALASGRYARAARHLPSDGAEFGAAGPVKQMRADPVRLLPWQTAMSHYRRRSSSQDVYGAGRKVGVFRSISGATGGVTMDRLVST
jgi:hypothetical protein